MERLQSQLFEAATRGDVSSLLQLLTADPLLLERVTPNYNSETALHVSALLGHLDFVKQIIRIKPELTNKLNSQRSSPLHLASAKGHVNVVSELLSVRDHETTCLAQDKDGLTPLHLAAVEGQVAVMELLLRAKPEAARLTLYGGETILHLCVKNWQVEAVKLLVSSVSDTEFVKCKDGKGNTLLHLAVEYKQVETINLLVNDGAAAADQVDVNAVNHKGLTAMDVLIRSRSDVMDSEIRESLISLADIRDSLVVSGFSSTNKFFAWVLLVAAQLAVLSALLTYDFLVEAWMPSNDDSKTFKPYPSKVMTCLFLIYMGWKYLNFFICSRRRSRAASSAVPVGDNITSVVSNY